MRAREREMKDRKRKWKLRNRGEIFAKVGEVQRKSDDNSRGGNAFKVSRENIDFEVYVGKNMSERDGEVGEGGRKGATEGEEEMEKESLRKTKLLAQKQGQLGVGRGQMDKKIVERKREG